MCDICINSQKAKKLLHQRSDNQVSEDVNHEQILLYDQHLLFKQRQQQLYEKSIQVC